MRLPCRVDGRGLSPVLLASVVLLAACPSQTTTRVRVRAYEAAPDPAAGYVVLYHPWSVEDSAPPTARGAHALTPVTGIDATCEGCTRPKGESFEIPAPARGAQIVVAKPGFAPVTIRVPAGKPTSLTYLVLLRKAP
jgi:hypothetical protein